MFDRPQVKLVREVIQKELDKLAQNMKMTIRVGNASFTPTTITFKVAVAAIGEDGKVHSPEAENFKKFAVMYGLQPTDLGRQFRSWHGNELYTITGLSPRRSKYPIHASRSDGRRFKFGAGEVKARLI
jgi:hypothetical protein